MNFKSLVENKIIADILEPAMDLLIAAAVILFLYGVIKYVYSGDNEEKRKEAKNYIVYGIIGLFVMVSVWGLVNLLVGTFSFSGSNTIPRPATWTP